MSRYCPEALVFLFLVLLILLYPIEPWILSPDSALYVGLAESLAGGRGYTFNGAPHVHGFPGLPLVLAPVISLFGRDVAVLNGLMRVFLIPSVPFIYVLLRRRDGGRVLPALATAGGVLAPAFFEWGFHILTESLFYLLIFSLLVVLDRECEERRGLGTLVLAVVLSVAAVFTRPIAVAAVGAWLLLTGYRWVRSRGPEAHLRFWRAVVGVVAMALPIAIWVNRQQALGEGQLTYATEVAGQLEGWGLGFAASWLGEAGSHLGWVFFAGRDVSPWAGLVPGVLIVLGWIVSARRGLRLLDVYLLLYLATLFVFPHFRVRYLAPIVPILVYYAFVGVKSVAVRVGVRPWVGVMAVVFVGALVLTVGTWPGVGELDARASMWVFITVVMAVPVVWMLVSVVRGRGWPDLARVLTVWGIAFVLGTGVAGATLVAKHRLWARRATPGNIAPSLHWEPVVAALEKLRAAAWPGDRVLTGHPRVVHVLTGLTAGRPGPGESVDAMAERLGVGEFAYVVVDTPCFVPDEQKTIMAAVARWPDRLNPVIRNERCTIYRWSDEP